MGENIIYVDDATGKQIDPSQLSAPRNNYIPTGNLTKSDKADLLDKIRPDFIVEVLKNSFMGKTYNPETKKWIDNKVMDDHKLTEAGATYIAELMLSVSSQNVSISNLKDFEINMMILDNTRTLLYDLVANWKKFGIISESQLTHIATIVKNNTRVVLRQPEGEGIRKLIAGIINENRVFNMNNPEEQKSRFSLFSRRGR